MTFYFKVRNDISVSTLTRIVTAMQQYLGAEGHGSVAAAVINDVKDLRIILRPEPPQEVWKDLLNLHVENMPRNGIVLIEEGATDD